MKKNTNNDDEERQVLSILDTIEMPSTKTMMTTTNAKRKASSAPTTPVTLTPSSSTVSLSTLQQENLPNNVSTMEQLQRLPPEFKSNDSSRPLQYTEENGETYQYSLRPMFYSVQYILLVELLERFCFYGINYTQTAYLTGVYNDEWNADYTAVQASSLVSLCIALAYTSPFWGATLADATPLGEYGTILLGGLGLYLPGLCLLCFTTIPSLHREFPDVALWWGMLFFWPMGTGMVKSVVNVFGAKQFHPLVQSADLETYYVNFYMCINVGALLGGILIPIVAQFQMTVAYGIPVVVLTLGMLCFVCGTNRYVRRKTTTPKKNKTKNQKSTYCCGCIPRRTRRSNNLSSPSSSLSITSVAKVCLLLVPFNIAYSQMSTTFIIQGTVLNKAYGILDAASMNNADTLSVLFFGYWIGNVLYPWLSRQYNIKLLTTHKFALGSFLGVAALSWALLVEYKIHHAGPEGFSVLWQIPSYLCIGMGEIFAVSTAYEVAFTIAPPSWKGLASAVNLFFIGGVPNMICLALYQKCQSWFDASDGSKRITTLETYTQAHVYYYFILLWCIATLGVLVNLLPSVTKWVQQLEDAAAESIQTPKMTPKLSQRRLQRRQEEDAEEQSPLVIVNTPDDEEDDRFEYGTCGPPLLNKAGSMRAGPTLLSQTSEKTRHEQEVYTKVQLYKQKKKKRLIPNPKTTLRRMLPPQSKIVLNKEAPY